MTNPFNPGTPAREEWERQQRINTGEELHRGQLRFAERLVDSHGHLLKHVHGLGWHYWDGKRWAYDTEGYATRAAIEVLKTAKRSIPEISEPRDARALFNDVCRCESSAGIAGILTLAKALRPIAVDSKKMDVDPWLFNVDNGTLDLRTGEILKHNPEHLITKIAGCGFNPYAIGPQFDAFMAEILPDPEVRQFVQRLFGSAMYGGIRDHVLPIFTGSGRNGKSTLVELVRAVFGSYAIAAEPELLLDSRDGTHPTGQADLFGVRLASTTETDKRRKLAVATVKRLTGGDKIRARRMRQDFFEFDPTHTLILVTNKLPEVAGDDPAIWRRIRVVPFDVVVPDDREDTHLGEKLRLEMTYVLQWAFNGYRQWNEQGLMAPAAVQVRTQTYKTENDTVGRWITECTQRTPHATRANMLWENYREWCRESAEHEVHQREFANALQHNGYRKFRNNSGNYYEGISLLELGQVET